MKKTCPTYYVRYGTAYRRDPPPRLLIDLRAFDLSTVDCRLSTVDCRLSIVDCRSSTVDCRQSTVDCRLSTVDSQLPTILLILGILENPVLRSERSTV